MARVFRPKRIDPQNMVLVRRYGAPAIEPALEVQGDVLLNQQTAGRLTGASALSRRYELKWVAGVRGKPGINGDINSATEATREIADPDFEILGTNAVSADTAFYAEGGITLSSHGGGTDSTILLPHLDANQSAWTQVTWGTDKETIFEADVSAGASVANTPTYWVGLKLTNTPVVATDADQAFFRYISSASSGQWQCITSNTDVDETIASGVTVAVSTRYHLKIVIDSARIPSYFINGALVATGQALADAIDLIPYVGVLEASGSARSIIVHGLSISRNIG